MYNEAVKTEYYKGYTIKVDYQKYAENPRTHRENVAVFTTLPSCRFSFGDKCVGDSYSEIQELYDKYITAKEKLTYFESWNEVEKESNSDGSYTYFLDNSVFGVISPENPDESFCMFGVTSSENPDESFCEDLDDLFGEFDKLNLLAQSDKVVIKPICYYSHSGETFWLGSTAGHMDENWDCGIAGFAYVEKSTLEQRGLLKDGDDFLTVASKVLDDEMEVFNTYAQGEVYEIQITDSDGELFNCITDCIGEDSVSSNITYMKNIIDHAV